MSEELRELRISRQLPAKEMVSVVKEIYPKYDKTMQSKCERGDEYGIRIRQDALEALYAKFDPEKLKKDKKKRDGHRSVSYTHLAAYSSHSATCCSMLTSFCAWLLYRA